LIAVMFLPKQLIAVKPSKKYFLIKIIQM